MHSCLSQDPEDTVIAESKFKADEHVEMEINSPVPIKENHACGELKKPEHSEFQDGRVPSILG